MGFFISEFEEIGIFEGEVFEVAGFIIGGAVLPAFPEDADPFEGGGAEDGVLLFASGFLAGKIRAGWRRTV